MSISLVMRAMLAAAVLSAAPAIANAQAPQAKPAKSAVHKAHAGKKAKKAKKRASANRLPLPEHPNGRPRW